MKQRSIRVAMPESLYQKLKRETPDHGSLSQLVRKLLEKHLEAITESDAE